MVYHWDILMVFVGYLRVSMGYGADGCLFGTLKGAVVECSCQELK